MSSIITLDDLTSYIGDDSIDAGNGQQAVDAVNDFIESQTGRSWGGSATVTERYRLSDRIFLRHRGVTAVASVKFGFPGQQQTTLNASTYFLGSTGQLRLARPRVVSDSRLDDYVEVTYTYGDETVPPALKQAALQLAARNYNYATNGQQDVKSASAGSYKVEFASGSSDGSTGSLSVTDEAMKVVRYYSPRRV